MKLPKLSPETLIESGQGEFGSPRSFVVATSGDRILFLRSASGVDDSLALHSVRRTSDNNWIDETIIDPSDLQTDGDAVAESDLDAAMLERAREKNVGITAFTSDARGGQVAFSLAGYVWIWDTAHGKGVRVSDSVGGAAPILSPIGDHLAYVSGRNVTVAARESDGSWQTLLTCEPQAEDEVLGYPDFVAAEELGRGKGMWWSPDGRCLLVQVTDNTPLAEWTIPDPAFPGRPGKTTPYPVAGGPNSRLSLRMVTVATGQEHELGWDNAAFPYLRNVIWTVEGGLTIDVQSRDQRAVTTLAHRSQDNGFQSASVIEDQNWVEVGNGTCTHGPSGELCQIVDLDGVRRLRIGSTLVSLPDRAVLVSYAGRMQQGCLIQAAPSPIERRIGLVYWDGSFEWLSPSGGVSRAWSDNSPVAVVEDRSMDANHADAYVVQPEQSHRAQSGYRTPIKSNAVSLEWREKVEFIELGDGGTVSGVLRPSSYIAGQHAPLPIIIDSYGGPLVSKVLRDRSRFLVSRWIAEQGFAVLITDGVGAPARTPAWERSIAGDLSITLDSQLAAIDALANKYPDQFDLSRVGIRGWSFGGYLAALGAIKRPDLFRAAVVGAPVSDWGLYDTHYAERYLGQESEFRTNAERSSLASAIDRTVEDGKKPSPMLIVHGFSDDNVVVAHSVRLSEHLVSHGISHATLLMSSVTHVSRGDIFAKLMSLELDFLKRHLMVDE